MSRGFSNNLKKKKNNFLGSWFTFVCVYLLNTEGHLSLGGHRRAGNFEKVGAVRRMTRGGCIYLCIVYCMSVCQL